jgi:hypothetical protein
MPWLGRRPARFAFLTLVASLLLLVASPAHAEPAEASEPYTTQVLIADVASIGMIAGAYGVDQATRGRSSAESALVAGGALGYFLAAPIIHMVHRRPAIGGLDLAMRLVLPLGMAAIDKSSPAPVLVSVGAISAFDALWLARPSDTTVPFRADTPLEEGDRVVNRPNWTLVAVGGGAFLLGYSAFLAFPCDGPCGLMRVPVVPPFLVAAGTIGSDWGCPKDAAAPCWLYPTAKVLGVAMAITDGMLQAGGLAAMAAGFLMPEKRVVRGGTAVAVRPVLSPTNVGIAGTF